jgi:hypothetical protein
VIAVVLEQPLLFGVGARGNAIRYTLGEMVVTGSDAREAMLARHTLHAIGYQPLDLWRVTPAGIEELVAQGRQFDPNNPLTP